MNITLRQLCIFAAVARHRSFTRAASDLNLTQPAVSMQVKQLEEQVGLALTEQMGRQIFLTEAGEEVFHHARVVMQQIGELEAEIDALKGVGGGRLRIAAISTANYFAPALLGTFRQRFPKVSVSMDVTNREAILVQLANNEVDMAIMGQPPDGLDVEALAFMENPLVIVAAPGHELAGRQRIPLKTLEAQVFLVREPGSGTRSAMERFFGKHDIKFNTGMEMGSLEAVKQAVQAGLGLGLVPRDSIEMEMALKRLVVLKVARFPILRHWYVVMRRGKRLSATAEAFKHLLTREAGALRNKKAQRGVE